MLELVNKVFHSQNTSDVSRIISEEETAKSSEDTHEIGLRSDWGLYTLSIRGSHDSSSRHDEVVGGQKLSLCLSR